MSSPPRTLYDGREIMTSAVTALATGTGTRGNHGNRPCDVLLRDASQVIENKSTFIKKLLIKAHRF